MHWDGNWPFGWQIAMHAILPIHGCSLITFSISPWCKILCRVIMSNYQDAIYTFNSIYHLKGVIVPSNQWNCQCGKFSLFQNGTWQFKISLTFSTYRHFLAKMKNGQSLKMLKPSPALSQEDAHTCAARPVSRYHLLVIWHRLIMVLNFGSTWPMGTLNITWITISIGLSSSLTMGMEGLGS